MVPVTLEFLFIKEMNIYVNQEIPDFFIEIYLNIDFFKTQPVESPCIQFIVYRS